ncbi:hypothetical protein [Acrocarpospora corrugata]|nr:hypothetical protein [Acrocarpospora corrugata]
MPPYSTNYVNPWTPASGIPDPGSRYDKAARFLFGLGFLTFGSTWIVAIVLSLKAQRLRTDPDTTPPERRKVAVIVAATTAAGLLLLGSGLSTLVDDDIPAGAQDGVAVEIEITSNGAPGLAYDMMIDVGGQKSSGDGVPLPHRKVFHTNSLWGLSVTASAVDDEDSGEAETQTLTCVIKVGGEILARNTSTGDGGQVCTASYSE